MSETKGKSHTTTTAASEALDAEQMTLSSVPTPIERIEREDSEVQQILSKSTQDALQRNANVTVAEVKRVLEARAELIRTIRDIAVKQTAPEDWTLYRARDGSVLGVPTAAAAMKIRRWAGVSIMNHRGMDGEPSPTVREAKNAKDESIIVIEGYADGICGRDTMPGLYFSVRSDDQFIGRAGADTPRKGGPRQEDLMSCWRTGIDSKVVRCMTGLTKVSESELKALGIDTARCVKGSGFGTASERAAGAVAEGGVQEAAKALWDEICKAVHGDLAMAADVLVDITKRAPDPKKKDDKGFAGFRSADRFTQIWQVENARKKFEAHEVFGRHPQGE
jgi:hypothetical protein